MNIFLREGKALLLAYDQGLEHGPTDFNDVNVDPSFVLDVAVKGGFTGIVFQKGVAEKYYDGDMPLILKLNGKTNIFKGEPISRQNCSVQYAVKLGAKAVGYTIYLGSKYESIMLKEFGRIQEEAHQVGLPVIAWIYPRGSAIKDDTSPKIVAYAARAGLELGADAVKIKYTGNPETFKWVVKSAGKIKVFMSGGPKAPDEQSFLNQVKGAMEAGASGLAVGRNVWQHPAPLKMARALNEIIFHGRKVEEVIPSIKVEYQ